jgi:hypothetical protein
MIDIPASRRLVIEVPQEVPEGRVILTFTPASEQTADAALADNEDWFENGGDCPLCARYHEPNEETIAAFEEGDAMERGEIPSRLFHSVDELFAALDDEAD